MHFPTSAHASALSLSVAEQAPVAYRETSDRDDERGRYFMYEIGNSGGLRNQQLAINSIYYNRIKMQRVTFSRSSQLVRSRTNIGT